MKKRTKKKIQGSVTVLLVIIMLPMLTFSGLIVDMSRLNMAKAMMSSAGDLAMNTALANYDTILKDVYGLFAMSQEKSQDELAADIESYFTKTLVSYGVVSDENAKDYVSNLLGDFNDLLAVGTMNIDSTNFLELENITASQAGGIAGSTLADAGIMRKQIVEYMKYRAPLSIGLSFLDSLKAFDKIEDQNKVIDTQVKAQESTQDITQACAALIELIREYDAMIDSINNEGGSRAIKGLDSYDDNILVPISEYYSQVDKYRVSWKKDTNYQYINKFALVFLANAPSVNGLYLTGLNVNASEHFIKPSGHGMTLNNCGINVPVTLAGTTAEAKQQVMNQITTVNSSDGIASSYISKNYLPSLYRYDFKDFNDRDGAFSSFIEFEKMLTDAEGDVKYSSVKQFLEQLYILGRYYENYNGKIQAEINEAQRRKNEAANRVESARNKCNNAKSTMDGAIDDINSEASAYSDGDFDMSSLTGYSGKSNVVYLLDRELDDVSDGKYQNYYNSYLYNSPYDVYMMEFRNIIANTTVKKSESSICTYASNYLVNNGGKSFSSYMKSKCGNDVLSKDLYKVLDCLLSCSKCVTRFYGKISVYNTAKNELTTAENDLREATTLLETKQREQSTVTSDYYACLVTYEAFTTRHQTDLYDYGKYIQTAESIVETLATRVNDQFSEIVNNIYELREKLNSISDQILVVTTAIEAYDTSLNEWETANRNYKNTNESDSFSKQTDDDIAKSRKEYNKDSFDDLQLFVISLWNEFDEFYERLTDTTHYKYGSRKINEIHAASDLRDALSGVKSRLPSVVTAEYASGLFASLYNADTNGKDDYKLSTIDHTEGVKGEQYCFLKQIVVPLTALRYINGAYPVNENLTDDQKSKNNKTKDEYDKTKNSLKSNSGKSVDDTSSENYTASSVYGYTYESKSALSADGLPSKNSKREAVDDKQFRLSEDDKKLKAADDKKKQSGKVTSMLGGLTSALNAGLENLYILSYIFDNFSYNTMLQDAIVEQYEPDTLSTAVAACKKAENLAAVQEINKDVLNPSVQRSLKTLSNFQKCAANNYLYGAEAEYILYGNLSPAMNITYAKASIYAIRFAFDCIFAFTDSQIRAATMSIGLAVQAATLGIVPYQVVQIVLQLALAAGEAAIDLDMMMHGLDVVIVKTKSSWTLGLQGISGELKSAAMESATGVLGNMVDKAVSGITGKLNDLVDAAGDEVKDIIGGIEQDISAATTQVVEDFINDAFSSIMSKIEIGLDTLRYMSDTVNKTMIEESTTVFTKIYAEVDSTLNSIAGDNKILKEFIPEIKDPINGTIRYVEDSVNEILRTESNAIEKINQEILNIKVNMTDTANNYITICSQKIGGAIKNEVDSLKTSLQGYITEEGKELAEDAKKEISNLVDDYSNKFFSKGNGTGAADITDSDAFASMIKFGYKEYLMLFMYIAICVKGEGILQRVSDVIQLNISNAGEGASFTHKKGAGFKMTDAYSYVSIQASAELDMFFLDIGLFKDFLTADQDTADGETEHEASKLIYKGYLGY